VGANVGIASAGAGLKGGRNQNWTDSDIGIASEDRSRIMGSLKQISDSRNWSSTRDGFIRTVSTSTNSNSSTSASGLNASLTEAQSYSREARRAEEIANRLESQASYFSGHTAAGSLNLSQAYREWGLAELEANRDYYGNARFDDIAFQLSPQGQALQSKFVESYAGTVRSEIEDKLVLVPGQPVLRPDITGPDGIHLNAPIGAGGGAGPHSAAPAPQSVHDEVMRMQQAGRQEVGRVKGRLEEANKGARGASEEAADQVKEW